MTDAASGKSGDTATPPTPGETTATPEGPAGSWFARTRALFKRLHWLQDLVFFFGGFCFDLLLLERIDSVPMLIHQGTYVVLLAGLIVLDHRLNLSPPTGAAWKVKMLSRRTWVMHFFFGTLLNAFIVFYFRAASFTSWGALVFMPLLAGLLVANELPQMRERGPLFRVPLYSFVMTSYFAYLFPVVLGEISSWMFYVAVLLSSGALFGLWKITTRLAHDPKWNFQRAVAPGLALQALLLVLYISGAVPPVPLSLSWIGVYHAVDKDSEGPLLSYWRPNFRPWEHGAETFLARPGDKVHVWSRIFAPKKFHDTLKVRWALDDPKHGWQWTDAIPLTIRYSGEHGWYGDTYKEHWTPGHWRVRVETDDGRVVGGIGLEIVQDDSTEPREFVSERR